MINLLISAAVSVIIFSTLYLSHLLKFGEALVPSFIGFIIAYFVLGFRVAKKLEALFSQASKELQNQKFDAAIATLKSGEILGKRQFGVMSQIYSQLGMIYFLRKDFNTSIPYFEKSQRLGHWMGLAMLAVAYFKKKDYKKMKEKFERLTKKAKKQGLAWNLYAYCLLELGEKDNAQKVLARAETATKGDSKVKDNLLALQNGKKIKMRGYPEWYQFHLEAPVQVVDNRRFMQQSRRRHWN